jgi:hypothetical protein
MKTAKEEAWRGMTKGRRASAQFTESTLRPTQNGTGDIVQLRAYNRNVVLVYTEERISRSRCISLRWQFVVFDLNGGHVLIQNAF